MENKKYYSYKTFYPEEISGTYKTVYGEVFNNLELLSDAELEELGFYPIELPEGLYKIKNNDGKYPPPEYWTHSYTWYRPNMEFIVDERSLQDIQSNINYEQFWEDFLETNAYDKIREASMNSLPVNTVATELISLFIGARNGNGNVKVNKIQNCLDLIFTNVQFTTEELQEIQEIFVGTGMNYQYTINLPNAS
jgi:hypothetical protein